eukprot:3947069-Lingulodinium_polyedra.AAC.1
MQLQGGGVTQAPLAQPPAQPPEALPVVELQAGSSWDEDVDEDVGMASGPTPPSSIPPTGGESATTT